MKGTKNNIVRLWFGADTPIRHFMIKMNPDLFAACQRVSLDFTPPSGAMNPDLYRKSDRMAFAKAVQQELLPQEMEVSHEPFTV